MGWRPDLLQACGYSSGLNALVLGKIYGLPVVIREGFSGFLRKTLSKTELHLARFVLNHAQAVLPVSRFFQEQLKANGVSNTFEVIHNTIDPQLFNITPERQDAKRCPIRILTVALLKPYKGLDILLEALAGLKIFRQDYFLNIIGDGTARRDLTEQASRLGLSGSICFQGLKSKTEVANFIKGCDFLVNPSPQETFGVAVIEALACGKPVIAADTGIASEIIDRRRGLLVPPADVPALTQALRDMLRCFSNYNPAMVAEGIQDDFGYEAIGRRLDHIYRKVMVQNA